MSEDILPNITESSSQKINNNDKDLFLATVAHDFKTPINAEINALKLLLNNSFGNLGGEQKEILKDILNSTFFLKDLVENVLCKNKIEQNKISLLKQTCSLNALAKLCIENLEYILRPKKQKIILKNCAENIKIKIDILEIKRVINNLISNASQYAPENSNIILEVISQKEMAGISVQDFGNGIPLEKQKEIFSKFVSYAKEYNHLGCGLGLYISKKIIEAHNGIINVESKINMGTKITILLPIE